MCDGRGRGAENGATQAFSTLLNTRKMLDRGNGVMLDADPCIMFESNHRALPAGPVTWSTRRIISLASRLPATEQPRYPDHDLVGLGFLCLLNGDAGPREPDGYERMEIHPLEIRVRPVKRRSDHADVVGPVDEAGAVLSIDEEICPASALGYPVVVSA